MDINQCKKKKVKTRRNRVFKHSDPLQHFLRAALIGKVKTHTFLGTFLRKKVLFDINSTFTDQRLMEFSWEEII